MALERKSCGLQLKFAQNDTDVKVGTISGYGSVFGNKDSYGDVIEPGAFKDTLADWKKRGSLPKMFLQHGGLSWGATTEDQIPIGVWKSMSEDDKGLQCEGELFALDTQKGRYIYEGLKSGALDGLSIGFIPKVVEFGKKPEDPDRKFLKVDLLEVSVVTFPANDASRVAQVKSRELIEQISTISEAEAVLRDAAGWSRREVLAFTSRFKKVIAPRDSESAVLERVSRMLSSHPLNNSGVTK